MDFKNRIKHAWNAFMNKDPTPQQNLGPVSYSPPSKSSIYSYSTVDRTMINSIINRIAKDVASLNFVHARIDEEGGYLETIKSPLNECLTVEANVDQTGRDMIQDAVTRMLKNGYVAIMPIESDNNPNETGTFEIYELRCADILEWYPAHVKLRIYDERNGQTVERKYAKDIVAIIQNPMYEIMNEVNAIPSRISKKLSLLDIIDNESASTKLNMIIQLPYNTRSTVKQDYAKNRLDELEDQLANSPRGIGYMDINEKLIQLNKPLENNLLEHIKYLMDTYKSQLGISDNILNNTANETEITNYYVSIIEPICVALCEEMRRKFFTKTARTLGNTIMYFKDLFRYTPIMQIAKSADILSRNEIMTSNELRQKMGMKPSDDPRADELNNANMPDYDNQMMPQEGMDFGNEQYATPEEFAQMNEQNQNGFDANAIDQYPENNFEEEPENPNSLFSVFK